MPTVLLLKLTLAPTLIALVSLAGRRWGPGVSGWLAGLPITGGPILLIVALERGPAYAAATAVAALIGLVAFVAFCLALGWSGRRWHWSLAIAAAYAAYFASGVAVSRIHAGPWSATALGAGALLAGTALLPRARATASAVATPPWWELAARIAATAVVVLAVTALAAWLGPGWIGVLTVFPTAATVLGGFTLAHAGPDTAARLLRGLHLGMLGGLPAFFGVVAASVAPLGVARAFAIAFAAACIGQAALLGALRAARRVPPTRPDPPPLDRDIHPIS